MVAEEYYRGLRLEYYTRANMDCQPQPGYGGGKWVGHR